MICDRIKEERKLAGYSQEEVADYLGIDRSTYTYYETGKIKIPLDVIDRIASLFSISKTFYLETRTQPLVFNQEDVFALSAEQRQAYEEQAQSTPVYRFGVGKLGTDASTAEKKEDPAPGLTANERYLLAKIRLLDKAGFSREVRDFLDDLMDSIPEELD